MLITRLCLGNAEVFLNSVTARHGNVHTNPVVAERKNPLKEPIINVQRVAKMLDRCKAYNTFGDGANFSQHSESTARKPRMKVAHAYGYVYWRGPNPDWPCLIWECVCKKPSLSTFVPITKPHGFFYTSPHRELYTFIGIHKFQHNI